MSVHQSPPKPEGGKLTGCLQSAFVISAGASHNQRNPYHRFKLNSGHTITKCQLKDVSEETHGSSGIVQPQEQASVTSPSPSAITDSESEENTGKRTMFNTNDESVQRPGWTPVVARKKGVRQWNHPGTTAEPTHASKFFEDNHTQLSESNLFKSLNVRKENQPDGIENQWPTRFALTTRKTPLCKISIHDSDSDESDEENPCIEGWDEKEKRMGGRHNHYDGRQFEALNSRSKLGLSLAIKVEGGWLGLIVFLLGFVLGVAYGYMVAVVWTSALEEVSIGVASLEPDCQYGHEDGLLLIGGGV